jgi:hypothetical protein
LEFEYLLGVGSMEPDERTVAIPVAPGVVEQTIAFVQCTRAVAPLVTTTAGR